jgi:hypothetical protein
LVCNDPGADIGNSLSSSSRELDDSCIAQAGVDSGTEQVAATVTVCGAGARDPQPASAVGKSATRSHRQHLLALSSRDDHVLGNFRSAAVTDRSRQVAGAGAWVGLEPEPFGGFDQGDALR